MNFRKKLARRPVLETVEGRVLTAANVLSEAALGHAPPVALSHIPAAALGPQGGAGHTVQAKVNGNHWCYGAHFIKYFSASETRDVIHGLHAGQAAASALRLGGAPGALVRAITSYGLRRLANDFQDALDGLEPTFASPAAIWIT